MIGAALVFEDVRFAYNGAPVLDGVDLTVAAGTVTALMGPSGCGKSTAVAIAAGLLQPTSGLVRNACRRTAVMFQDPLLLPWRTTLNNVAFALKADRLGAAERRERARAVLAAVGLAGDDLRKFPRQLSGGMRRRVALARALVVEPDLVLLDEPFSELEIDLAHQMRALVRAIVEERGASALIVTHDEREAAESAEQVIQMSPRPARIVGVEYPGRRAGRTADRQGATGVAPVGLGGSSAGA